MADKKEKSNTDQDSNNLMIWAIAISAILVLFNQWQIMQVNDLLNPSSSGHGLFSSSISLSDGEKITYAPVLLAAGETPVLSGYKTKIKQLPTISSTPKKEKTGDVVQDTLNMLIPTGTPEYGQSVGLSFDDPIVSQRKLGSLERSVQLNSEQEQRWNRIANSFTCDYCCGSPARPTIITRCGCDHAAAWRGLAKYLIQQYDNKVSDEQIIGELSKWKALWYPGPTVKRVVQEQQLTGGKTDNAPVSLDQLPGMVGGC